MHTFDMLDLPGAKAGQGTLVLGPRDARGAHGALDVDNGRAHRRPPLSVRDLVRRHAAGVNWIRLNLVIPGAAGAFGDLGERARGKEKR